MIGMATMTSRERVRTALARQEPDRVPVNYSANAGIDTRLKAHFGLSPNDTEGLLQALEVDFRLFFPPYRGPRLHPDPPEPGVTVDPWGIHRRWIEHPSGGYWDYCGFPLRDATEEEVARWPMPNPDHFEYAGARELRKRCPDAFLAIGGAGIPDIINGNGMLRTMEQTLVDLATDDPAGLLLARRRAEILFTVIERTLEILKGKADGVWMGEDLGTQIGPLISRDLYRRHLRPIHQRFVDLARAHDLPVVIHSCGSSSWAFEDFIEMGITAVDTLQPEAAHMAPSYLKSRYGDRLAFHGAISTAGPLATGTPDDVRAVCRQTLAIMMPGGGYCLAPTHAIQDNTPTENVLAMYEAAKRYGRYR